MTTPLGRRTLRLRHPLLLLLLPCIAGCGEHAVSSRASTTAAVTTAAVRTASRPIPTSASPAAPTSATPAAPTSATPDDHGGDAASATPLEHALPYAGQVEVAGDEDWFSVTLRAGVAYDLRTFTTEDTTLELLDASGATVASNDDEGPTSLASRIAGYVPATTATFRAVVRGFQAATPRYVLRVYPGASTAMPRLARAELIDVDRSGSPTQGDQLLVTFDQPIRASSVASGQAASDFALPVAQDDLGAGATVVLGPAPEQAVITLGQSPTLVVAGEVDGRRRAPGSPSGLDIAYSNLLSSRATSLPPAPWVVDLTDGGFIAAVPPAPTAPTPTAPTPGAPTTPDDHGDTAATATPVVLARPFLGQIDTTTDVDCFAMDLRAGVPYTFLTETVGDTSLELVDPSGQRLAFNDDAAPGTGRSQLAHTPTTAGRHALLVRSPRGPLPAYALRAVVSGAFLLPRPRSARFVDQDGSGGPSAGDTVVVTFTEAVDLLAPSGALADDHFDVLVAGDTFGAGATVTPGPAPEQLTLVLGASPLLTVGGAFDGRRVRPGAPSGVDVDLITRVTARATGQRASRWAVDLE